MEGHSVLLLLLLNSLILLNLGITNAGNDTKNGVYIVYMGAVDSTTSLRNDHAHLLNSVLRRNKNALVHNYKHGFSGFAARLSKEEASSIAKKPGVVSVFPDPILKLQTTRSWNFLKNLQNDNVKTESDPNNSITSSNIVVGLLDTGIWPEAPSFKDNGMGPVPSSWKGTCMKTQDFNSSNCNRKLIGARYYTSTDGKDDSAGSPRDTNGHGTHTASTAVGAVVPNASYYGLAAGTARGGSPESRLAVYKVCYGYCYGSAILAGFDDAIADGVDVLSLSLGSSWIPSPDLTTDPVAIGAFHAVERGILVVCSAGNEGPGVGRVINDAPWILTVAATTIDRELQSNVVLGNNEVIRGLAINFTPLSKSPDYALVYGESAKKGSATLEDARRCHIDALDGSKVEGKIVICKDDPTPTWNLTVTLELIGGLGLIHITDYNGADATYYGDFPVTVVTSKDATTILDYVNSTRNPMATILPTVTVPNYKPAPMVVSFSSRGPSTLSKNILKPDIAAPGVDILAAWIGNDTKHVPKGKKPSQYNIISGTSMSCPHVSGLAGSIKSRHTTWSASAIKSAIMTSATQNSNLKAPNPMTTDSGSVATPYDYGAGEISPPRSIQPGLVYETSTVDYLNYLCYIGLNVTTIKLISSTVPDSFSCPKDSSSGHVSNINYPSIAITNFNGKAAVNVSRTVTNVGEEDETVYSSIVDAPSGVNIKLIPEKLQFTKSSKTLSYQVIFSLSSSTSLKEDVFGSIAWSNGKYIVRSPFVLAK